MYFWRDQSGTENDCLIESAGRLALVEVKSGRTISADYFQGLEYWHKLTGSDPGAGYIVYGGDENQKRSNGSVLGWRNVNVIMEL